MEEEIDERYNLNLAKIGFDFINGECVGVSSDNVLDYSDFKMLTEDEKEQLFSTGFLEKEVIKTSKVFYTIGHGTYEEKINSSLAEYIEISTTKKLKDLQSRSLMKMNSTTLADKELFIQKNLELGFSGFSSWLKEYLQDDDATWGREHTNQRTQKKDGGICVDNFQLWVENGKRERLLDVIVSNC